MRIVAGDIGGTKTLLRCVDEDKVLVEQRFDSTSYKSFDTLLTEFFAKCEKPIDAACFAVAGPVLQNKAEVTNLHWAIDATELADAFGVRHVALINDFYAIALGVPLLGASDRMSLNEGMRQPREPIAIIGAGTGLGEALVVWSGDQWHVVPSEGGHADFAPQNEQQSKLMLWLIDQYGHASWERVCSGMGLVNIFTFLGGPKENSDPARIADLASSGDPIASDAIAMFVDIYGAEAGNMALRALARGGVHLAGGIAAKNVKFLSDGRFMNAFCRKGRFAAMLREMPVDIITDQKVGLRGAAEMARRFASLKRPMWD
jgi:glucokinase